MSYDGKVISLIMASLESGIIGLQEGGLPWKDSDDLQWFKRMTMGNTVIVGSKTFETLPPLKNRHLIVCTKRGLFSNPHSQKIRVAGSIEEAISMASTSEIFIGGGRQIYETALPYVDRFYISRISLDKVEGRRPNLKHNNHVYAPFLLPWEGKKGNKDGN